MRIAVIGAGIGGLTLKLAFHSHPDLNIEIILYERDAAFDSRPQGYSLTIQQGIKILDKLGLAKTVRELKCRTMGFDTVSKDGKYLNYAVHPNRKANYFANIPIPRQDLRRLFMQQLPPESVKWGKELKHISHTDDGKVALEFTDGEQSEFDAVVGCDGVRSIVRDYIVGDKLNYLGVVAINGIARDFAGHDMINNRSIHSLDGTSRLFVKPFSEYNWMWQLTFPMQEELMNDKPKLLERAKEVLQQWHAPVPELLACTPVDTLRGGGIYDRPMPDTKPWRLNNDPKCHNITILGDAAHPMSPFKGQGANSALEDAWRLFSLIAANKNNARSINEFEDEMWKTTRDRVLNSRKGVEFLHTQEALDTEKLLTFLKGTAKEKENAND